MLEQRRPFATVPQALLHQRRRLALGRHVQQFVPLLQTAAEFHKGVLPHARLRERRGLVLPDPMDEGEKRREEKKTGGGTNGPHDHADTT